MACHETIQDKCADACTSPTIDQPCGGTVLRCLTEKLEEIADAECKKEVFYFVKMEARTLPPYAPATLHARSEKHVAQQVEHQAENMMAVGPTVHASEPSQCAVSCAGA